MANVKSIEKVTSELRDEILQERLSVDPHANDYYRPAANQPQEEYPTWRIRLELAFGEHKSLGLDINSEMVLGRGHDSTDHICLFDSQEAEQLGVSRRHAVLRPEENKLYILDLGSTNGTFLNGHSIGVNMPYALSNGDHLMIGRMEMIIRIVKRPRTQNESADKSDPVDILPIIAHTITSQLKHEEALKQAMEMAMRYTPADEVSIWLVDEYTGELFLEAGRGGDQEQIRRLPVNDTLAGQVIANGEPMRVNRKPNGEPIKVKTGYLVEAIIYVPLTLGGVTFGVMSLVHREPGMVFSHRDEQIMAAVASFTAVAIQNARLYDAADRALARRIKTITALSYALTYDLKKLAKNTSGYAGLISSDPTLTEDTIEMANNIAMSGDHMSALIDRLMEITRLSEDPVIQRAPCDLVNLITQVVNDLYPLAVNKNIRVRNEVMGTAQIYQGDAAHLYRCVYNLVENALQFTPEGGDVGVILVFSRPDILIRVFDSGPGIPEADLPYLFNRYFRTESSDGKADFGLGLEVVRATVEAHRGQVGVRNLPEGGAEFTVVLPAYAGTV